MKNSIKREQSQACLNFAERKNFRLQAKYKILMTLALLITAVGGAWAKDDKPANPVISGETEFYDKVTVTITCATSEVDIYYTLDGSNPINDGNKAQKEFIDPFTLTETTTVKAAAYSGSWSDVVEVTFTKQTGPKVTWDAATKTGTFEMPAYDVEIAPIYAPVAQWATDGEPTAIEGIIAGEAKDIVKAGTVAKVGSTENAQGTLMYLVTTTKEQPTSTTGFSATVPTGATLTGSYAEDQTVYVWYYIKGIDAAEGVTPTAENTFNDSEICTTPLPVKLKANLFTLTLDPAPVKNITVTVAGQAKTPTDEGKVTGVKMENEVKLKAADGYKFRKVEVKKGAPDVKIESFSIHTSSNDVYSDDTFTCSIIDILPANATNQTFEWKIESGAPAGIRCSCWYHHKNR